MEDLNLGPLDVGCDDYGEKSETDRYWETKAEGNCAIVTNYAPGAAYPYATTKRDALFDKEPIGDPGANDKYLVLDLDKPLDRRVTPNGMETNILMGAYDDGIYADTLVRLTPCVTAPELDGEKDKIVVWMRDRTVGLRSTNEIVITAGRYVGSFGKVERCDYVVAAPAVAPDTWFRLTIRAIPDITGVRGAEGQKACAFTVYFDGEPVVATAAYDIGSGYRTDWLTPEARILIQKRRLFPCLFPAGSVGATEVSRFSFSGQGAVDDVLFTTYRPEHVLADKVFTIQWDRGVKAMTCVVSNSYGIATNEIDATALPRYRDLALGTNGYARVLVTNVVYDTALDYTNGTWWAENDCTVADGVFTYDGEAENPIGFVASSRKYVTLGGPGGCETFAEAKTRLGPGMRTILLSTNLVVTSGKMTGGYNDGGRLAVVKGDDFILDLNGHTLRGKNADPTVQQTGGKLVITDTSEAGTGRVLPPPRNVASVKCTASSKSKPDLTINAGWYDGAVIVTGKVATVTGDVGYWPACEIQGGSFTNFYNETKGFYLNEYVAPDLFYGLSDGYWKTIVADAHVWCGKGADARWDNADNWKGGRIPGADDTAIFPWTAGHEDGWAVDFGSGVATKKLWLDVDIAMAGTNEFSDVTVVSGVGRLSGSGTATFTAVNGNELPGVLTADGAGSGEIRLAADWKGTVRISKVTKAQPLKDIMGWGRAGSKVEFNGVRGYLSDRANYALPYELVLTDADEGLTPAWRNDTGYTGSVVSFPKVTGSGTFESPKNTREILQVFQFENVESFKGKFNLGGKRILLGTGEVVAKSAAGHFTFSDAVKVRSHLGWHGVSAHFGATLGVTGAYGDRLLTFSGAAPEVAGVVVNLTDVATGEKKTGRLAIEGYNVVIAENDLAKVGDETIAASEIASIVKSGSYIEIPAGSAVAIEGNDVIVNGRIVASVADYYTVKPAGGEKMAYAVAFDETKATPALAEFTVSAAEGKVAIRVANAKPGLWYGVQAVASLAEKWPEPSVWKQAEGDVLALELAAGDSAQFFRVLVTDRDPNGGAK